jgi:hypothetical protein
MGEGKLSFDDCAMLTRSLGPTTYFAVRSYSSAMASICRLASVKLMNFAISRVSAARWRQYSTSLGRLQLGFFF